MRHRRLHLLLWAGERRFCARAACIRDRTDRGGEAATCRKVAKQPRDSVFSGTQQHLRRPQPPARGVLRGNRLSGHGRREHRDPRRLPRGRSACLACRSRGKNASDSGARLAERLGRDGGAHQPRARLRRILRWLCRAAPRRADGGDLYPHHQRASRRDARRYAGDRRRRGGAASESGQDSFFACSARHGACRSVYARRLCANLA